LQQTRVEQGTEYYHRFIDRFPDITSLALASMEEVLLVWQGLGYYSRARNMHHTAGTVVSEFQGIFPSGYEELVRLKGIGVYTAAAISSICSGEARAAVDGNVHRVISRLFGIAEPPGFSVQASRVHRKAMEILDRENPGIHNQAMMELGARICMPSRPLCRECPASRFCFAYREGKISDFPQRKKAAHLRKRYFNYLVIMDEENSYIRQRTGKDIWLGLYEFPLIESNRRMSASMLRNSEEWQEISGGMDLRIQQRSRAYKHLLTHQEIHARFYLLAPAKKDKFSSGGLLRIRAGDLKNYPVPVLITRSLDRLGWMDGSD